MGSICGDEAMQGLNGREERIYVTVRMRPLNEKEIARHDVSDWECINDTTIIYRNNLSASERSLYPTAYTFDRVFRHDCSTRQVYEEAAKEVALSVVSGINSSVFAYGQTSSGKTYTMSGITEYTGADIFDYIEKHKERQFVLKFSAIEIYNESVRDLLSSDSSPRRLLDDPERGTVIERLTEETLMDWNHFTELISFCEAQRQIGETSMNEASSRSHQILRLTIESSAREFLGNDKSSSLSASVNFVDLAGSERASQTLSAGARLKEGCHINRSLLTLGTVIRKLSKGRNGHIPFRDSKLTRILQSSLGGNARTAIICTMSPARSHVEQTRNTLLFASCAKEVSTNAQVNVVMSDKALVKQLQRELSRLENELRNSGTALLTSDAAALLREKDLQIEKLKREVTELTLQRDLAHSQIKDMLHVVGDDYSSLELESLEPQYPKLRVRSSLDFENHAEAPKLFGFHSKDSVGSFDASQYSDGHSFSSDDNLFQLPDLEKNFPRRNSSPPLTITVRSDWEQEKIEEQHPEILEDLCKEVRCIDSEDPITDRYIRSDMIDLSPNHYADSNVSSPRENTATTSGLIIDENRDNKDLGSSILKECKKMNSFRQLLAVPPLEKIFPIDSENNTPCSRRRLKLTRTKSCKASLMRNSSSDWFDKEEIIETTPPTGIEKEFTGRPEGIQRKSFTLNYNANAERQFGNGSENYRESADLESVKQLANHQVQETEAIMPAKNFKDVGLDPIQSDGETPSDWPSDFKKHQREIIQLWHECHVSLVHRTYFFLLFKGESSDSIYMEVELRRLSFLKDTFSRGDQTVEDGRTLTPSSSMRYLRRERQMLSKQMHRRMSRAERDNLYKKWGIKMNSKHRRLQLAHLLWNDTEDMNHIRESAAIVAKLVCTVEPDEALKEMFGLNFAPRQTSHRRKSFGWTVSMKLTL
ncbi:hypothetical protein L6164_020130 [Bauhinia variegata]|uniref:Uncharacterized protein n=1 Tax=Bauhinia variegata TaxID=167791 RepID=A0ACB9MVF0_BAUVA|nr:hypothetical protein L6164_020130 [Bauhinia variegata]